MDAKPGRRRRDAIAIVACAMLWRLPRDGKLARHHTAKACEQTAVFVPGICLRRTITRVSSKSAFMLGSEECQSAWTSCRACGNDEVAGASHAFAVRLPAHLSSQGSRESMARATMSPCHPAVRCRRSLRRTAVPFQDRTAARQGKARIGWGLHFKAEEPKMAGEGRHWHGDRGYRFTDALRRIA